MTFDSTSGGSIAEKDLQYVDRGADASPVTEFPGRDADASSEGTQARTRQRVRKTNVHWITLQPRREGSDDDRTKEVVKEYEAFVEAIQEDKAKLAIATENGEKKYLVRIDAMLDAGATSVNTNDKFTVQLCKTSDGHSLSFLRTSPPFIPFPTAELKPIDENFIKFKIRQLGE